MSVKFKIRSNPYEQKTVFYRYDNSINDYIPISKETDPDSKLVSENLTKSFFSFKAKEILKEIDKQFSNGDSIEITFEGTYDDYVQLRDIIDNSDLKNKFKLKNGEKKLYRGAELLDEIILIFKQIEPLVRDFKVEQIEKNIKSFTDASSNIIPVCVIGNVSVGKSTFINSLIGKEILPCGDEPVTAKIYKIAQSKNEDIAEIKFYYYDEEVRLRFERDQYEFLSEPLSCEFIKDLKSEIERIREFSKDVDNTVSNLLGFVNNYEKNYMKENEERHISDLIELKVFFKSEELRKCNNPIVFFDTPGSNSASNKKHFEALSNQLNDLSNGLPIYVSTSMNLDTNDNQILIDFINAIPQLDKRFTMIVVNKADDAGLKKNAWTEEKQAEVLGETVPRELYSYGLFYVSSLMGLGSKTDGEFLDESNAERYEDNKEKFSNPENKYYKQLYYFNILPIGRPIEIKENGLSKNQLILKNSGFYDVENFIRIYVNDYSAYNKCRQAKLFLYKMIELIANKIDEKTDSLKKLEKNNRDLFTDSEEKLKEKIEEKINKFSEEIKKEYEDSLNNIPLDSYLSIDSDEFKKREKEIREMLQECNGLTDLKNNDKYEKEHLRDHLSKNFKEVVKRKKGIFAKLFQETKDDSTKVYGNWKEIKEKTKKFKDDSHNETMKMIKNDFTSRSNEAYKNIDETSKKFWTEKSSEIKDDLIALVTDSEGLEEKQKRNLEEILIKFEDLNLLNVATDNFDEGCYTGFFSNRVKFEQVETTFKNEMRNTIDDIREKIKKQHFKSFKDWINKLRNSILENLNEMSKVLRTHLENIHNNDEEIKNLINKKAMLENYSRQIDSLISWI